MLNTYYKNIDAIEAYEDNYMLCKAIYSKVFKCDIKEFDWCSYDIIILGDILEHLTVGDAQNVLQNCIRNSKEVIVVVPYEMPQHALYNNVLEIHLQPDLTPENFKERYPQLNVLFSCYEKYNPNMKGLGVYVLSKPKPEDIIIQDSVWNGYRTPDGQILWYVPYSKPN